jgi:hypothetical protein
MHYKIKREIGYSYFGEETGQSSIDIDEHGRLRFSCQDEYYSGVLSLEDTIRLALECINNVGTRLIDIANQRASREQMIEPKRMEAITELSSKLEEISKCKT